MLNSTRLHRLPKTKGVAVAAGQAAPCRAYEDLPSAD